MIHKIVLALAETPPVEIEGERRDDIVAHTNRAALGTQWVGRALETRSARAAQIARLTFDSQWLASANSAN